MTSASRTTETTTLAVWLGRKSVRNVLFKIAIYIVVTIGAAIFALPFYWMLSTAVKPDVEIFAIPPIWIPTKIKLSNFPEALTYLPFVKYLGNTMFVTFMTLLGALLSCPLVAYSFARLKWPGRELCFYLMLSTIVLPQQVTMIPLYIIFSRVGWINTFRPLYIRAFFGLPFFIFLLRQFFMTIPSSLDDAAKIDGCTPYGRYVRVMLPLVKPGLVAVCIFIFLRTWNDFLLPLVYLHSPRLRTLALALQVFQGEYEVSWGYLMAASTAMTIPVIIIFFALQRYFIKGIVLSGMKG